jgi:transcriptional regulator with XRE-family HTH domain
MRPAAGVIGARFLGDLIGDGDVIAADMGGTTFKVGVIQNGQLEQAREPRVDRFHHVAPRIEAVSIGAGGGSVVSVDPRTRLPQVGPRSAGARPGPVCYGQGGTEPRLTDVMLPIGHMDPGQFLGGSNTLDRAAAERALGEQVAEPPGLSVEAAAIGIHRIASAWITDLIREITVERGLDPRDFVLHAFGGSCGMLSAAVGEEPSVRRAVIPRTASVDCAFGPVSVDIAHEHAVTATLPADAPAGTIDAIFAGMETRGRAQRAAEGVSGDRVRREWSVDLRCSRQVHEVTTPVAAPAPLDEAGVARLVDDFEALCERKCGTGSAFREAGIEMTMFRLTARGLMPRPALHPRGRGACRLRRADRPAAGVRCDLGREGRGRHPGFHPPRPGHGGRGAGGDPHPDHHHRPAPRPPRPAWTGGAPSCWAAMPEARPHSARPDAEGGPAVDPMTFPIIRHRLFRILDEMVITLKHVSGSAITNEGHDLMVSLCRADGTLLMGGVGVLHHLTSAAEACKAIIRRFAGDVHEGDVLLPNDPCTAALHASDIYRVAPISGGADPLRRPAGRLGGLFRARRRRRRRQPGRLCPAGARHLLRRVLVARDEADGPRHAAPRRAGHDPEHGPLARDGDARPALDDRLLQRGARPDAGADRQVRPRDGRCRLRAAARPAAGRGGRRGLRHGGRRGRAAALLLPGKRHSARDRDGHGGRPAAGRPAGRGVMAKKPASRPAPSLGGLGAPLRQLRLERGWSPGALSAASGVPPSTISTIETGQMRPSLVHAINLAGAIGANLGFLPDRDARRSAPFAVVRAGHRSPLDLPEMARAFRTGTATSSPAGSRRGWA